MCRCVCMWVSVCLSVSVYMCVCVHVEPESSTVGNHTVFLIKNVSYNIFSHIPSPYRYPPTFVFFLSQNKTNKPTQKSQSSFCVGQLLLSVGFALNCGWYIPPLERTDLSSPITYPLQTASWPGRVVLCVRFSILRLGFGLARTCVGLVRAGTVSVGSYAHQLCSSWTMLFALETPFHLIFFSGRVSH